MPDEVPGVDGDRAPVHEVAGEPGEPPLEHLLPGGEQHVRVAALRDPAPRSRRRGQGVPLQHDDGVDVLAQRPRGQQSGHAGADDDRGASRCFVGGACHGGVPFRGGWPLVSASGAVPPDLTSLDTWSEERSGGV
ncbi:hypothetical protein [Isoptericola sp. AK164]|uniref:hypothetical protein n=1 Tax=Isoptericola sp. AK164 TaxID=3024246 RepID=UPI002418B1CE|nr:hypothetical protein [Isoptericola sp. AK164]